MSDAGAAARTYGGGAPLREPARRRRGPRTPLRSRARPSQARAQPSRRRVDCSGCRPKLSARGTEDAVDAAAAIACPGDAERVPAGPAPPVFCSRPASSFLPCRSGDSTRAGLRSVPCFPRASQACLLLPVVSRHGRTSRLPPPSSYLPLMLPSARCYVRRSIWTIYQRLLTQARAHGRRSTIPFRTTLPH
ncbi:uncharacterized protein SCHCODRAFT_02063250 [Schizophyllum commune H4-8]|uniref:uncharacterized protein n=1 Tax=Schizophyllum commune (strain H4-8 / FGSC 9210) TaxID=578458 RepID=UPI00216060AB|nr:uncharacterized protein SCHCODRAFT_02063250 [Schizophyllum commune H4-8]KAI5888811.1 hypothetical protein SCHCODRAFT_02063250 [Schizophyllum commune H4-8]